MIDPVQTLLKKAGSFSERENMLLEKELQYQTFKKDEVLLAKGDVCSALGFCIEGSFIQYNLNDEIEKNIIDLTTPGDWIINHKSFATRRPSEYMIQAYTDCKVYLLSIESIHKLIALSQNFLRMGKILDESASRVDLFDRQYTPDEKYQYLLDTKPALLQHFPQKFIASYLKMTPETLSRVRSRFSKS